MKKKSPKKTKKLKKRVYKPEDLKPHHSRPYRKRHYGLLILSLLLTLSLVFLITSTSLQNHRSLKSAKDLVSSILGNKSSEDREDSRNITSALGFAFQYDPKLLQASGVDSKTKNLYVGQELSTVRAYSQIKVFPVSNDLSSQLSSGSIDIQYHQENPVGSSADLVKLEAQYVGSINPNYSITSTSRLTISDASFVKSEWSSSSSKNTNKTKDITIDSPTLTSYTSVVNNSPFVIIINNGLDQNEDLKQSFKSVVDSLSFPTPQPMLLPLGSEDKFKEDSSSLSLLDRLTFTKSTSAASFLNKDNSSERVSLLYSPAVVKLYNFYCMDINLNNRVFVSQSCSATTGSGFLVGSKGYVATNGHVVVNDPLSIAITYAFEQANKGNTLYFSELAQVSGLTQSELDAGPTNKDKLTIAINKFYKIPSNLISVSNKSENILVGLNNQQPDLQKLLEATKLRQEYKLPDSTKKAQVISYNYRAIDGAQTGVFTASDVALLKIDDTSGTNNYPSVKLGDISSLMQGSNLNIIGYPGAASSNPLVEASQSIATLTSGKVSSIKSASGSQNKLIETDATIGHGNSGGPAFNDSGEVVGIATYTIDGSGEGDGVFNYVRDIADFKDLTTKEKIDTSLGQTQTIWEEAVDGIYNAKYTKAVEKLKKVKELYPAHSRVDQLIILTQGKSDSKEEVKQFPVLLAAVGTLSGIFLLITSILLIVQHSRKHEAYKEHLSAGNIPSVSQSPVTPLENN